MRWSIGPFSLPRQYAPATFVSLNAPSRLVDGTCGPRHRSTKLDVAVDDVAVHRHAAVVAAGLARVFAVGVAGAHLLDDLALVRLVGEHLQRVVVGELLAHEALVLLHDRAHLGFDAAEVVVAERLAAGQLEVVVEAVGDRGTDRVLGAGEQPGDGLGQHVRGRVAQHLAPVVAVGHDDRQRRRRGRAGGRGRSTRRRPWPRPRPWRGAGRSPPRPSAGVVPASTSRVEPSGSVTVICSLMIVLLGEGRGRSRLATAAGVRADFVDGSGRRRSGGPGRRRAAGRARAARRGASGSDAAGEDRAREIVERFERARRVEVVVDRVAHALARTARDRARRRARPPRAGGAAARPPSSRSVSYHSKPER